MRSTSGRQFLAPVVVGREQVRLMPAGGNQVEQDADAQRFVPRHAVPKLIEAGEQKAGVARLMEIGFVPPAAELGDPGKMHA
jgi:hypothetical protein